MNIVIDYWPIKSHSKAKLQLFIIHILYRGTSFQLWTGLTRGAGNNHNEYNHNELKTTSCFRRGWGKTAKFYSVCDWCVCVIYSIKNIPLRDGPLNGNTCWFFQKNGNLSKRARRASFQTWLILGSDVCDDERNNSAEVKRLLLQLAFVVRPWNITDSSSFNAVVI